MSYQNEDVLYAFLMKLLDHLRKITKSHRVEGEHPSLVCIVQVIPLHILEVKNIKYSQK